MNEAIDMINNILVKYKIDNATYITSPYNTSRLHNFLYFKDLKKMYIYQNTDLPKKNNFFERSLNKKEIIYEITSIIYNGKNGMPAFGDSFTKEQLDALVPIVKSLRK